MNAACSCYAASVRRASSGCPLSSAPSVWLVVDQKKGETNQECRSQDGPRIVPGWCKDERMHFGGEKTLVSAHRGYVNFRLNRRCH